eukprot:m.48802 g.48802  ORF g.48802 m.48802 type:complete len:65 (-) comp11066_c0_seq1:78-272(-)
MLRVSVAFHSLLQPLVQLFQRPHPFALFSLQTSRFFRRRSPVNEGSEVVKPLDAFEVRASVVFV